MDFKNILDKQRQFFLTGATLPIPFRIAQLNKLKSLIDTYEQDIILALKKDLNKPEMESYLTEIYLVKEELKFVLKNIKSWCKPIKVSTPFPTLWPGRSKIHFEPYGSVLIMSPWNYPFMLLISPLIGAMGAGNCVILKPSEISSHTQNLLADLINQYFPVEYVTAIKAGPEQTQELLKEHFDYIFYTGSSHIGKLVMEAAAKHLTPVTLELGGKSPCIVDATANLKFAAHRIVWSKFVNAGQTCIAPDYLYIHESCKNSLINYLQESILQFYGENAEKSLSYGRIINNKHFQRLKALMQQGNILFGGKTNENELYISPTLIDDVSWKDPILQEEIFGPLLPILTFNKIEEVIQSVKQHPKPLALYLFTKDNEIEKKIMTQISFGGGCVNDCMLHLGNLNLPFGGVGQSGMGNMHGKFSFNTFSHPKSIYKKVFPLESGLEYPPFTLRKFYWVRKLLGN